MRIVFLTGMLAIAVASCGCSNDATPTKVDPAAKLEPQDSHTKAKSGVQGGARNIPPMKK